MQVGAESRKVSSAPDEVVARLRGRPADRLKLRRLVSWHRWPVRDDATPAGRADRCRVPADPGNRAVLAHCSWGRTAVAAAMRIDRMRMRRRTAGPAVIAGRCGP